MAIGGNLGGTAGGLFNPLVPKVGAYNYTPLLEGWEDF